MLASIITYFFSSNSDSEYRSHTLTPVRSCPLHVRKFYSLRVDCLLVRPLLVAFVNVFLVISELTKACVRAVIIIHYSIILPQLILNIS